MRVGDRYIARDLFYGPQMPWTLAKDKTIGAASKVVFAILCACSDGNGQASPSREELAEACGMSVRTIAACLVELEKQDFIIQEGRRDRRIVWGFVWHEALVGNNLRKLPDTIVRSVQELPTSERGSVQVLHTTADTSNAEPACLPDEAGDGPFEGEEAAAEPSNHAESALDSVQNLHEIVGNICTLRSPIQNLEGNSPEGEGKRTPPPGTSLKDMVAPPGAARCGGSSSDSPSVRGSPDPELQALFDLARESIPPGKIGDTALLTLLKGWRKKHGASVLDSALEVAKHHEGPFSNWINFVAGTIENKKRKEAESSGRRASADDPRITAGR